MDAVCSKPVLCQIRRYHTRKLLQDVIRQVMEVDNELGRERCRCADAGTGLPTAKTVTFRKTSRPNLGKSTIKYTIQKDVKKAIPDLRRVYAATTLEKQGNN